MPIVAAYPAYRPPHRDTPRASLGVVRRGMRGMGATVVPIATASGPTQLPYPPSGGCSGQSVTSTTTGALTTGISDAASLIPIPIVGQLVSMISGLFGGSHASAVAQESQILCSAVPAANTALQQIISQVQSGSITPAQGSQLLSQLQSSFASALAPLKQQSGCGAGLAVGQTCSAGSCNGGCLYKAWLGTIVNQLNQQWAANPPSASVLSGSIAGIPTWALLLGAGLAAWAIL
jgi:hypothetical protein